MSRKPLNIGVCGVGTVGLATIEILRDHSETLLTRSGQAMVVSHVGARREHPNHDYGEAWRDMRMSSLTDLILQKLLRVKQIEDNNGQTLVSEGLAANYQDIINYAIFALIHLKDS